MRSVLACNNAWGRGGQGNFLQRASSGLATATDVTVFCAEPAPPPEAAPAFPVRTAAPSELSRFLHRTPLLRRRRDWVILLSDVRFDRQAAALLDDHPADLVVGVAGQCRHLFERAKARGAQTWLYCLNTYLPFMKEQIARELQLLGSRTHEMAPRMLARFERECALADRILVNSEVARQTFIDAGFTPERIHVLHPVVDVERFHPVPPVDDVFRVLHVGTICPRKGAHYLVEGFRQADLPADAELLLVGGPSTKQLREWLHVTVAENPSIRHEIHNFGTDDPAPVFGRCSAFVLASVEDGFGVVALEAMACGLPAVVTSHCGAADVVEDGVNGFVVPPRDPAAIAERLRYLAAHPDACRAMGRAARQTAEQHTQTRYDADMRTLLTHTPTPTVTA